MALPLVFSSVKKKLDLNNKSKIYEDGGTIDNLPVRFGIEVEKCDLLFVLPLNASFKVNEEGKSLTSRLLRTLEIMQGALERNALRSIHEHNKFAVLNSMLICQKEMPQTLETEAEPASISQPQHLAKKTIKPVTCFGVCPDKNVDINTMEFWKSKEAANAFDLMYRKTKTELNDYFQNATIGSVKVKVVKEDGEIYDLDYFRT